MQLTFILVPHVFALTTIVFHVVQSQAASSSPSQATSKADSLVHDVVLHGGIMRTCVAELVGECWYTAGVFEALALACEMCVAGQGRRAADSRVLVPVCRFWSLRLPVERVRSVPVFDLSTRMNVEPGQNRDGSSFPKVYDYRHNVSKV